VDKQGYNTLKANVSSFNILSHYSRKAVQIAEGTKMTDRTSGTPNLVALLIGIDCYLSNRLPDSERLGGRLGFRPSRRWQDALVQVIAEGQPHERRSK